MKIDILYFEDCPSWQDALDNLKSALEAEKLQAEITLTPIEDNEQAARLKFLGSPSFCTHGRDWWPEERDSFSLSCRVYHTPNGMKGVPTVNMLREKLRELSPD